MQCKPNQYFGSGNRSGFQSDPDLFPRDSISHLLIAEGEATGKDDAPLRSRRSRGTKPCGEAGRGSHTVAQVTRGLGNIRRSGLGHRPATPGQVWYYGEEIIFHDLPWKLLFALATNARIMTSRARIAQTMWPNLHVEDKQID